MPGLIGGIARTAVAAGTWTAVSGRVARRQANRWAEQDQQQPYYQQPQQPQQQYYQQPQQPPRGYYQPPPPPPPPPAAAPARDRVEQLKDLANLKAQGILTEQEFAAEKARILG